MKIEQNNIYITRDTTQRTFFVLSFEQIFRENDKSLLKRNQGENVDVFVVMPEYFGVLDELFEILLLKQYGEHNKTIYIVYIDHKFDLLISLLEDQNCNGLFTVISENEFF